MKKVLLALALSLALVTPAHANQSVCNVQSVFREGSSNLMSVNSPKESFVVYLFDSRMGLPCLNELVGKKVLVEYDTLGTNDIYDDEILGFTILD